MNRINSYPSIFSVMHKAIQELKGTSVYIEEKVDGSQFSFCMTDDGLKFRSKGQEIFRDAPNKMFENGVNAVIDIEHNLKKNWTYRGEYLQRPKHNTLAYDRIPKNHVILFDVQTGVEEYLSPDEMAEEALRLGFESVPFYEHQLNFTGDNLESFLEKTSILGGQLIEGVVIKQVNKTIFGSDKKSLVAKFVSPKFKEIHQKSWKSGGPRKDAVTEIGELYKTEARWNKAIQHLKESGDIEGSPADIGKLLKEIGTDTKKECEEEIKEKLFKYAWPIISRIISRGFPEWYKEKLIEEIK